MIHGILSARDAGLAIKINMVALKGMNEDEIASMLSWCVAEGLDLSLIETMPLGAIDEDRVDRFPAADRRVRPAGGRVPLPAPGTRTGGPARYWQVEGSETGWA